MQGGLFSWRPIRPRRRNAVQRFQPMHDARIGGVVLAGDHAADSDGAAAAAPMAVAAVSMTMPVPVPVPMPGVVLA